MKHRRIRDYQATENLHSAALYTGYLLVGNGEGLGVTSQIVARMKQRGMRGFLTPIIPGSAYSTRATLLRSNPATLACTVSEWA